MHLRIPARLAKIKTNTISSRWAYPPIQCGKDVMCANDGVCNDGLWGANCTCMPGFTGTR